jgi:hypothetical protein
MKRRLAMRLRGIRLPLLAAAVWAGICLTVYAADLEYRETIYVSPTSTTVSLSPTYAVSRSYVPTEYVIPTYIPTSASYIATSYYAEPVSLLPTAYVATTYRRGLFGRRWLVERPLATSYGVAYLPSSYIAPTLYPTSYRVTSYLPTTWQYPSVLATSYSSLPAIGCDDIALATPSQPSSSSRVVRSSANGEPRASDSGRREEQPISSAVDPAPDALSPIAPLPDTQKNKPPADAASTPRGDTPPIPPSPSKPDPGAAQSDAAKAAQQGTAKAGDKKATDGAASAKDKQKAATTVAPDGNQDQQQLLPAPEAPGSEGIRHETLRPNYSQRARRLQRKNILFGTIESDTGAPREEVPVSVVSRTNSQIHHDGISDAFGTFAISVPDGEWTIKVTQPSGRVSSVRSITVRNGKVMDNLEAREIFNLIISF